MTEEVILFFRGIDVVSAVVAIAASLWILNFIIRKLFPNIAALNDILSNLKHVEDIPKMKEDINSMKEKVAAMEKKLTELVESNLLARGEKQIE